ncbi:serine hydrolase domain-containing protein [Dongia sp.]|uniref:serine hydrolase domain-containing protein n=1 Tax=Dongia sp. TaxID=1977262 RepID=UPI0035ADDD54
MGVAMDGMPFQAGLMQGSPASVENQVTLANWRTAPFNRWAFSHVSEIIPSAIIAHDPSRVRPLATSSMDLTGIAYRTADGKNGTVGGMVADTFTDGFLALHQGRIVTERYAAALAANRPHIVFSVSKSITGSLAGLLVAKGELDPSAPVSDYLPETTGSAYGDATVRQVLDMTVAIDFTEDYLDPKGDFMRYRRASGWNPVEDPAEKIDLRGFLATTKRAGGEHGHTFHYVSPNSDLLGWLLERASGSKLSDLLSDRIWQHIGAEMPAYVTVDRLGAARTAGGMSATLRDLGRFGEMMRCHGEVAGKSIVPRAWIDDILRNGDAGAWSRGDMAHFIEGGKYRSKWYIVDEDREAFCAVGIHGQWIFIDRKAELVAVKVSSQPLPVDEGMDRHIMAGLRAIGTHFG